MTTASLEALISLGRTSGNWQPAVLALLIGALAVVAARRLDEAHDHAS